MSFAPSFLRLSLIAVLASLIAVPSMAADKNTKAKEKAAEKTSESMVKEGASTETKTETKTSETKVTKGAEPVAAPVQEAAPVVSAKPAEKIPDTFKAGNVEVSGISIVDKGGHYEIYMQVKNNNKFDDALTSVELVGDTGEIVTVARVTSKEISNQDEIKKAQEEARKAIEDFRALPHDKDGKDKPKQVDVPKPEYKDVTKDVEGSMIMLPSEKTTKLEGGENYLKLSGLKTSKGGDSLTLLIHFRSSPNITAKAKMGAKSSFIGKIFGN